MNSVKVTVKTKAKMNPGRKLSAETLKAIREADRDATANDGLTYEEFLDMIEKRSPHLKARIARDRRAYEQDKKSLHRY